MVTSRFVSVLYEWRNNSLEDGKIEDKGEYNEI